MSTDVKSLRWVPPRPSADAPVILVVEDDPDAQQVAVSMLHIVGYRTLTAGDGRAALEVLKRHRPCAILLDLHMPGLDGIGFLDIARRELDYYDDLPIIATSGVYRDEMAIERPLRRRRVVTFVHKPFTLARLEAGLAQAKVLELSPPAPPPIQDSLPADLTDDGEGDLAAATSDAEGERRERAEMDPQVRDALPDEEEDELLAALEADDDEEDEAEAEDEDELLAAVEADDDEEDDDEEDEDEAEDEDELLAAVEADEDDDTDEPDPEATRPPVSAVRPAGEPIVPPVPPPRPTDSLRKAARLRMTPDRSGQPTPHVLIPDPSRAGEEHAEEERFICYFGAAIFIGSAVESVALTEVSAAGVRILADQSKLVEGDEVRVRAHVDLPGRGGLLDLTIHGEIAWTEDLRDKFHAGLSIDSVKPMEGYAKLLAGLARRNVRR